MSRSKLLPLPLRTQILQIIRTTPNISTNPSSESDGSNVYSNEDDHSSHHNPPTDSAVENITTTQIATNNNENSNNPMYDRNTLLRKAAQWIDACKEEEMNNIHIPKLTTNLRFKLRDPLKDLFENKIKDLISLIDENSKDENDRIITEGII